MAPLTVTAIYAHSVLFGYKKCDLSCGTFSFLLNENTAGVFPQSLYGKARINVCLSWRYFCVFILQSSNVGFVVFLKKYIWHVEMNIMGGTCGNR